MPLRRHIILLLFALLFLFIMLGKVALLYTDWLWFQSVGFQSVFSKVLVSRVVLFVIFFTLWFVMLYPLWQYTRQIAAYEPSPLEGRLIPFDERLLLDRYVGRAALVVALLIALIAALIASNKFAYLLRFLHPGSFALKEPIFHKDVSFYVFRLPWWSFVYQSLYSAVVMALIGVCLLLIYDDTLQLSGERFYIAAPALKLAGTLVAALVLLKVIGYQLNAWNLLLSDHPLFTGANYTDVHVRLPVLRILMVVALVCGVTILFSSWRGNIRAGLAAVGIYWSISLLAGTILPAMFQRVFVSANELHWERQFLRVNIQFTRYAYDLDRIVEKEHPAEEGVTAEMLRRNRATVENIRIWDKNVLTTYQQLQEIRSYYRFLDVDIDRYRFDGEPQQVMLAARELSYDKLQTDSWINYHLKFTHGYGLCLSPVNRSTPQGLPELFVRDIPPVVAQGLRLRIERPQIYFGEWQPSTPSSPEPFSSPFSSPPPAGGSPTRPTGAAMVTESFPRVNVPYAIVNTATKELDYPSGDTFQTTTYTGKDGVRLNSWFRRMLYAWKFSSLKILVSSYLTPRSRIIYNREVIGRARLIAPFLRYDNDPYLVVSGGRLYWILDAYTSTRHFPYAQEISPLGTYLRNSVKVVIDAYDGTVTFYRVDTRRDPLVESYARIFPHLFRPLGEMSADLRQHLRYPQGYFMVQAEVFCRYHMTDVDTFFSDEDRWEVPRLTFTLGNEEGERSEPMEPFYVTMRPPGSEQVSFMLIIPFTAKGRDNMRAWLAANCDEPNYGQMTVFLFPKKENVYGPAQVKALINQNEKISQDLTLWGRLGSRVLWGNLLVVPMEKALLYVQPLYLRSEATEIPELKRVIVVNGSKVVMAERLDLALEQSVANIPVSAPAPRAEKPSLQEASAKSSSARKDSTTDLIIKANEHYRRSVEARKAGDWAAYGRELDALEETLKALLRTTEKPERR